MTLNEWQTELQKRLKRLGVDKDEIEWEFSSGGAVFHTQSGWKIIIDKAHEERVWRIGKYDPAVEEDGDPHWIVRLHFIAEGWFDSFINDLLEET